MGKLVLLHNEMISAYFLSGNVLLIVGLKIDEKKNQMLEFLRVLCMKSESMPNNY